MTEQERPPRTEAEWSDLKTAYMVGLRKGRTEGRQQAVREIPMDRERLAAALVACMYRDLRYRNLDRQVQRISDEYDARGVAGLNASESPTTEERRAYPASRRITGSQGREARRDASESGQPPEASDE